MRKESYIPVIKELVPASSVPVFDDASSDVAYVASCLASC